MAVECHVVVPVSFLRGYLVVWRRYRPDLRAGSWGTRKTRLIIVSVLFFVTSLAADGSQDRLFLLSGVLLNRYPFPRLPVRDTTLEAALIVLQSIYLRSMLFTNEVYSSRTLISSILYR